jgi:phosphopantetheine--protein transferase-like protein
MPLLLQQHTDQGILGLWQITEELDELENLAQLSLSDAMAYSSLSAEKRKKEWLATRVLLNELAQKSCLIKYHENGRPYLDSLDFNLSISHTQSFVAILMHPTLTPGIDIEQSNREIVKVAPRFLSARELAWCSREKGSQNRALMLHWCAKEAIFKMIKSGNIEFSTDIAIYLDGTTLESGQMRGVFTQNQTSKTISLEYLEIEKLILVWGITNELNKDNLSKIAFE